MCQCSAVALAFPRGVDSELLEVAFPALGRLIHAADEGHLVAGGVGEDAFFRVVIVARRIAGNGKAAGVERQDDLDVEVAIGDHPGQGVETLRQLAVEVEFQFGQHGLADDLTQFVAAADGVDIVLAQFGADEQAHAPVVADQPDDAGRGGGQRRGAKETGAAVVLDAGGQRGQVEGLQRVVRRAVEDLVFDLVQCSWGCLGVHQIYCANISWNSCWVSSTTCQRAAKNAASL